MNRGVRVRRKSNGVLGRIAGPWPEGGDGHVHVKFDSGTTGNIPVADLLMVDEPTAGDAPAREIGKALAGGEIEHKGAPTR